MPLQRRIQTVKLNYSLILKFKCHFVGANFHSVLGHAEFLNEALRIEQVCKIIDTSRNVANNFSSCFSEASLQVVPFFSNQRVTLSDLAMVGSMVNGH